MYAGITHTLNPHLLTAKTVRMKTKFTFLYIALAVCVNIDTTTYAQAVNMQDSLALVDLYNSTNGPIWRHHYNWLTGPVSTWWGITVTNTRVTTINLEWNNLNGSIPSSLGNLVNLVSLSLPQNQLSGSMPPELGNLVNLQTLDLSENQLSGNIPSSLGNLVNLQGLYLYQNLQLSGNIPSSLGNLVNLTFLALGDLQLSGNIPSSLGNLVNLQSLSLNNLQLSGSIPPELGNLVNLQWLSVINIPLSGNIPSSFGNLVNLQSLVLVGLHLSGSIPPELGNLVNLQDLWLSQNQLSGNIPSWLGNLVNLHGLLLDQNQLSGSIPPELGSLHKLEWLYLNQNQLSGSIPPELGKFDRYIFISLDISNNRFTFDGMELVPQEFSHAVYAPQAIIPVHKTNNTLYVSVGGTPSNNTFYWYKDGVLKATIVADSTYTPATNGHYTVAVKNKIATQLTLFSDSALAIALPLTLLDFTALKSVKVNLLLWSTSHEINSSHFNIQRSNNRLNFSSIGLVQANNANNITNKYQFIDRAPLSGTNYYRLQIVDKDGSNEYSDVRMVKRDVAASLIYPLPANNILIVETNGNTSFSLIDQSGKILFTTIINSKGTIDVSRFNAGTYFLRNNSTGNVQKIVIAR